MERRYAGERDGPDENLSVLRLGRAILGSIRLLAVLPVVFGVLGLAFAFLTADYVARSQFAPRDEQRPASGLLGMAQQFGLDVGSLPLGGGGNSVEFYARLLDTDDLLRQAVDHRYRFAREEGGADTISGNLLELYEIDEDTPEESMREGVEELRERIQISRNGAAGIVSIRVEAEWAGLAEQINRRLLDLVNRFNIEKRQSQAQMERKFVQERLADAHEELRAAEAALQEFRASNRRISDSPELQLREDRLQREVSLRQQVYTNLVTAFEQARIDEVRDTPVLTVIGSPEGTGERESGMLVTAVVAAVLGLFVAVIWALTRAYVRLARESAPDEWAELAGEARKALPRFPR